jgi:hypothetical protein
MSNEYIRKRKPRRKTSKYSFGEGEKKIGAGIEIQLRF